MHWDNPLALVPNSIVVSLPLAELTMNVHKQNCKSAEQLWKYKAVFLWFLITWDSSFGGLVLACVKVLVCIVDTWMCRTTLSMRGLGPVRKPILKLETKTNKKLLQKCNVLIPWIICGKTCNHLVVIVVDNVRISYTFKFIYTLILLLGYTI